MPSDDVILNLRQIAGYPSASSAVPSDSIVLQRGGLGGPYLEISPPDFVGTALANGGNMAIGGQLTVSSVQAGSLQASSGAVNLLTSQSADFREMEAAFPTSNGMPLATQDFVQTLIASVKNSSVWSFMGRTGDVRLWLQDVLSAGGAPIYSPRFQGAPMANTPAPNTCNTRLATTAFVHGTAAQYVCGLLKDHPFVFTFNGRTGDVVLTPEDIGNVEGALLNSPALSGVPTAPTAPPLTNSTQLATTEYVDSAVIAASSIYAPIQSPNFSGLPTGPTAPPGTSSPQLATTSFVMNAITESTTGVASFNSRTGAVQLEATDVEGVGAAMLTSPAFQGTPTAPTAPAGANSSQIATCSWVLNEIGGANIGVMSFNGRGGAVVLNTTDIVNAGGAPLVSAQLSGVPTAPTAATGVSTDQLATTAFVMNAVTQGSVVSFNGRTGAVSLLANDVSAAGGVINPNANLTGVPTAPTATAGTSTTQLATCAFVAAALAAATGPPSSNVPPLMDGTASPGSAGAWSRGDHVHPTDTSRAAVTALANYLPLAGGALTGNLTIQPSAGASLFLTKAASGQSNMIASYTGSTARWAMYLGNGSAEGGSNAGSDFQLQRYSDAGNAIDNPLIITRSSGAATFSGQVMAAPGNVGFSANAVNQYLTLNGSSGSGAFNGGANFVLNGGGRAAPSAFEFYWASSRVATLDNGGNWYNAGSMQIGSTFTSLNGRVLSRVTTGPANPPSFACVVDGYNAAGMYMNVGANFLAMGSTDGSGNPTANFVYYYFSAGYMQLTWGTAYKPGGGPWTDSSDSRIKTVVREYDMGLEEIRGLRPVVYTFKGNDTNDANLVVDQRQPRIAMRAPYPASGHYDAATKGTEFVGLVAQEAEQSMPDLVSKRTAYIDGEQVDDLRDLDPNNLTFALINAVKQLASRIEVLEARR